tara:strand:+ start:899 stop:1405 length:507 start_codon:yes stop_codon:yes gene_type:complete
MIQLINGNGQLGDALRMSLEYVNIEKDVYIYHTWNPWDRDIETQQGEYAKFKQFVDLHKEGKVIFISTCSQVENYYVHFKQLAEAYMLTNCEDCLCIRLPNLIGPKGILKKLKDGTADPYGKIELMTVDTAAKKILELTEYSGPLKSISLKGEEISAIIINEILHKVR